jgi:nitroimidazol reductase NimA-like FMN-containing flavoprotein (pyridoxamine 5'-phosphate oxidase superfamily)
MSLSMSQAEREEFLAGVHVGVLSVSAGEGQAPITTPVWYSYQPGGTVNVPTNSRSRKAVAIAAQGRFALCAQQEQAPCKYVTVEGPAVIETADPAERIEISSRYLSSDEARAFVTSNPEMDDIVIRMTPDRWRTADFSKLEP